MEDWIVSSVNPTGMAEVDEGSLQKSMDKNKESLQKKLLLRRPINQLVEQGIMPPLNTPPAFHEQRQKLERAKMGDFLKSKIQKRPERQELIQQHILEDTKVDRSLQEKQRQLKKAHLADDLNDRISHRPGPLELIKGNILQADEMLTQAVKEGQIPFKKTSEGEICKHPPTRFVLEEDNSSEGALSPLQDVNDQSQHSFTSIETRRTSPIPVLESPSSYTDTRTASFSSPPSSVSSPAWSQTLSPPASQVKSPSQASTAITGQDHAQTRELSGGTSSSSRSRKKSKSKIQPKTKTIKFHEYKGPPSAQKPPATLPANSENSYELLLQQQQLFLQWQLEWKQKYPQIVLSSAQKPHEDQTQFLTSGHTSIQENNPSNQQSLTKLEEMKVSDLKAELKRRNLPVSGSKPHLIERLKSYFDGSSQMTTSAPVEVLATRSNSAPSLPISVGGIILDTISTIPQQSPDNDLAPISPVVAMDTSLSVLSSPETSLTLYNSPASVEQASLSSPASVVPMEVDNSSLDVGNNITNEDIVKIQQRKIQELQWELQKSKLQLQHQQSLMHHQQAVLPTVATAVAIPITNSQISSTVVTTVALPGGSVPTSGDTGSTVTRNLSQCRQPQEQRESNILPATSTTNLRTFLHSNQPVCTVVSTDHQNQAVTAQLVSSPQVSSSEPSKSFPGIIFCQTNPVINKHCVISASNGFGHQRTGSLPNFNSTRSAKCGPVRTATEPQFFLTRPPPDYKEVSKQKTLPAIHISNNDNQRKSKSIKSQAVDDVLEILIKNGELSPSAAHEPATPTTPETQTSSSHYDGPVFPTQLVLSPPSTMLNECDHGSQSNLELDFHLDLENLEAMDLGGVLANEDGHRAGGNCQLSNMAQSNDQEMDLELTELLNVILPHSSSGSTSSDSQPYYCGSNDHDPLLSTLGTNQDTLDLFSLEEIETRPPPALAWDFAT
ncbi:uncharacterized protein LOC143238632 [Tachypleus tridentatus]|uniref:uncharacterized protein LOC143238632 n=1 Tax=Tachypleus tridentatus TaxID=6853 RepID=UPI003FD69BFD